MFEERSFAGCYLQEMSADFFSQIFEKYRPLIPANTFYGSAFVIWEK